MPKKREELINKAATHLGIPRSTLYRLVEDGRIPSRELELGTVLIDLDAAEKLKRDTMSSEHSGKGRPAQWG